MANQPYRRGASSQFGDTTLTKVFVGGLAWETQRDTMRRYFEQFGEILEAVVITDKVTGRSKGYGFVTFRDPEAARRACMDPNPIIDGRKANCNIAAFGRPRPSLSQGRIPLGIFPGASQSGTGYLGGANIPLQFPYAYHQGIPFSPYQYPTYVPDITYSQLQSMYNPYIPSQFPQMYGSSGNVSPAMYSYGHMGHHLQAGPAFPAPQPFGMQSPHVLHMGSQSGSAMTSMPYASVPTIPSTLPSVGPSHTQLVGPSQTQPKLTQGGTPSENPSGT